MQSIYVASHHQVQFYHVVSHFLLHVKFVHIQHIFKISTFLKVCIVSLQSVAKATLAMLILQNITVQTNEHILYTMRVTCC